MNTPYNAFNILDPNFSEQYQKYLEEQNLQNFKINLKYHNTRAKPSVLDQIFAPLKNENSAEKISETLKQVLLGEHLGYKKLFQTINLQVSQNEEIKDQLDIDLYFKDRRIQGHSLLPTPNKKNYITGQANINFKNTFGYFEKQKLQVKYSIYTPFKKYSAGLYLQFPFLDTQKYTNVKYSAIISNKKPLSNNTYTINNITTKQIKHSLQIIPKKHSYMSFTFSQKLRQNIYNTPNVRGQQIPQPFDLNTQNIFKSDIRYKIKPLSWYWIYGEDKQQTQVLRTLDEEKEQEVTVQKFIQLHQNCKLSNQLTLLSSNSYFTTKFTYRNRINMTIAHKILYNQFGSFDVNNQFNFNGQISTKQCQINDSLKGKNLLGFQEIYPESHKQKCQALLSNNLQISFTDYPLLKLGSIKPFIHLSAYYLPTYKNSNIILNNQQQNSQNFFKKSINRVKNHQLTQSIIQDSKIALGTGFQINDSINFTFNVFNFNGNKLNFDTFSRFQINLNEDMNN